MTTGRKHKILCGSIALLGAAVIWAASGIGPDAAGWGPRMVPALSGLVMVLAGVAIMFERGVLAAPEEPHAGNEMNAVWLVAIAALYVLAIGYIGYLAATFLAAPVLLVLFGTRSLPKLIGTAILAPILLHVFFFELLGIFPPRAAWFDLAEMVGL